MNPSIAFETKPGQFYIVRVLPHTLKKHIKNPKAFNALIADISGRVDHDVVAGGHKALPLGPELSGEWFAGSPVGAESSTPDSSWHFEQRVALALSKETHPLMVIPAKGLTQKDVEQAAEHALGSIAKDETVTHQERTLFDACLDNLWSDGGGTC